jgi:hypothetical protein
MYNVNTHLTHFRLCLFAKRTKGKILKEDYLKSMRLKSFLFLNDSLAIVCLIEASSFPQIFLWLAYRLILGSGV